MKIHVPLSEDGIDNAIRELDAYETRLTRKCEVLREKVAERIAWSAANGFRLALLDDWIDEEPPTSDVLVEVEHRGQISIIFAHGTDAVFIEFGAGVTHNGAPGASPHPLGVELGFTIGEYGHGLGRRRIWGFYDDLGEKHLTRGTPAAMPMYKAVGEAVDVIHELLQEVFGDD